MKQWLIPLAVALTFWSCGGSSDTLLATNTDQLDRSAQVGGNFLDVPSFPTDLFEFGSDKDEIEALIDQPMVPIGDLTTSYLEPEDRILGIEINGEARAYPHNLFWYHEIANDIVGGIPIIVSYCPLTGSGMAFDARDSDGSRIILGVSGLLFNNNLVMYDQRDQETLYPQMIGLGVSGPRKGATLKQIPVVETTWRYWRQLHPTTLVLSGLTNIDPGGLYTLNPYVRDDIRGLPGRFDLNRDLHEHIPFPLTLPIDQNPIGSLLQTKDLVLGVRFSEIAKAYPTVNLGNRAVVNDDVDGHPIVVIWYEDEKMIVPFSRQLDGQTLTFDMIESDQATFPFFLKDKETQTFWNLRGEAFRGQHAGKRLSQVPATNAYWFAWATFWQNTGIY
jgi:hypothetical protein